MKSLQALTVTVAACTALAAAGPHHGGPGCQKKGYAIIEAIPDLTEEQEAQLKKLADEFGEEMKAARKDGVKLRTQLRQLIDGNADEAAINKKIDELTAHHGAMMKKGASRLREAKKILTPDQQEYLKDLLPPFGLGRGFFGPRDGTGGHCQGKGHGHQEK